MKSDIIVVGGGIIGLYSAYLLALQGIKTTLIDRGEFGQESTWAAGGILAPLLPWDYKESVLYLTNHAASAYQTLSQNLLTKSNVDIEYWRCGLTLASEKIDAIKDWCNLNGYLYSTDTPQASIIHLPDFAQLRPPKLIHGLVKKLELLGVKLLPNTNVTSCEIKNNKIFAVDTSVGKLSTSTLVWTTGAWSTNIFSQGSLIESPNIKPIKGQVITLENDSVNLKNIFYKDDYYLIPRKDGLILVGSTLEDVGFENSSTKQAQDLLLQKSIEMMPELVNSRVSHHWSGLRPGSTNNLPTIGPHPNIKGLYFNCGHFRYGITMAPKSCDILTDWVVSGGANLSQQDINYSQFN